MPEVPPPVSPAPDVTPVMVPGPGSRKGLAGGKVDGAVGVEVEAGLGGVAGGCRGEQVECGSRSGAVVAGHFASHSKRGFTAALIEEL